MGSERQKLALYMFYCYICNICDRIMPDYLNSSEAMYLILRRNLIRLCTTDDDRISNTSSRL